MRPAQAKWSGWAWLMYARVMGLPSSVAWPSTSFMCADSSGGSARISWVASSMRWLVARQPRLGSGVGVDGDVVAAGDGQRSRSSSMFLRAVGRDRDVLDVDGDRGQV